jgi:Leucine-rich repeat (LRR) protein
LNSEVTNFEDKILPQDNPKSLFIVCYDNFEFPYEPEELSQLNNITLRNVTESCYQDLIRVIKVLESVETLRDITFMDIETDLPIEVWNLIQINKLTIYDSNIESIPPEIGLLSNLEILRINYSNITDLPNELVRLDSLREVWLESNKLTRIPDVLTKIEGLKSLILYYNEIGSIPQEITNLKDLQELDLSGNKLTSVPNYISELPNLTILNLRGNQIHILPDEIIKLSNLIELDLSANQIEVLPDSMFTYPRLRQLNLSDNNISEIPTTVPLNYSLQYLNLSFNAIDEVPEELFNLKGLTYHLGLGGNNISELSQRVFDLKGLYSLSLYENPYSFEDLRSDFNKRYSWFYILSLIITWCPFIVYAFFLYKAFRVDISRSRTILYYMLISIVVGVVTSWIIPYLHYHLFKLEFFYIRVFAEEWWKLLFPLYGAVIISLVLLVISYNKKWRITSDSSGLD